MFIVLSPLRVEQIPVLTSSSCSLKMLLLVMGKRCQEMTCANKYFVGAPKQWDM